MDGICSFLRHVGPFVTVTVTVKNFRLEISLKMKWHSPNIYRRPQKNLSKISNVKLFTVDPYFGGMFKTELPKKAKNCP